MLKKPYLGFLAVFLFACDGPANSNPAKESEQSRPLPTAAGKQEPNPDDIAALVKLEIELDQAEGGGDRAKAYLAVLDMLSKMGKHSEVLRRGEEFLTTPFLPISDPFNGDLKRPTQKANS